MSRIGRKFYHFVTAHFKAVFRGDLNSGGHKCHFQPRARLRAHQRPLTGSAFFTKNKNEEKSGFSESFSKLIPMSSAIGWDEFKNHPNQLLNSLESICPFSRFLPFSPIFFQMLIFKCHKNGKKSNNLSILPVTENQRSFSVFFLQEGVL